MRLSVFIPLSLLLIFASTSLASDILSVIERVNTETANASDSIEGSMYEAIRVLKQQRILLEQEMEGMSGSDKWVDHERVDQHIMILAGELNRAANEYLPSICIASAKLNSLAKKGLLDKVIASKKAPPEVQEAIDNLFYMEESMAMWHHYVDALRKGCLGLNNQLPNPSTLSSIKKAVSSLFDDSQLLVSGTFPGLLQGLMAARDMCSGKEVDLGFLEVHGTGCANCGGDGCANCMLPPGEHHDLFDFGCGDECGN